MAENQVARLVKFLTKLDGAIDAALLRQAENPMGHHWVTVSYLNEQKLRAEAHLARLKPVCDRCGQFERLPRLRYCSLCWELHEADKA
jgi:hypothetical protein